MVIDVATMAMVMVAMAMTVTAAKRGGGRDSGEGGVSDNTCCDGDGGSGGGDDGGDDGGVEG